MSTQQTGFASRFALLSLAAMTRSKRAAAAAIVLLAATALLLYLMGRPPICTCGSIDLWVGEPNSSRTSQMLSDWYSPSHIVHGFLSLPAFGWLGGAGRWNGDSSSR